MSRRHTWLTYSVRSWLERAEQRLAERSCGGDQNCPWCRRWVNQSTKTSIREFGDGFMDEIRCGHCGGTSLWKWEHGFFFITAADPPPAMKRTSSMHGSFIDKVIADARARIAGRGDHEEPITDASPANVLSEKPSK